MFDTRASTSLYSKTRLPSADHSSIIAISISRHEPRHGDRTVLHGSMLLIQSLASSTLSARRPIDCDAAGPAGDGIMGGSRSVVDGCARGLTPSGPAGHGPPPGAARQKAWRGYGLVGRIAGMPTNLTIQTLLGDVVGSTGHRYAVTDNAGNAGNGEDHHESGWRLPRRVPHRKQGESGKQHGPGELGVPAHPGSAGHSTHDVRAVDRWVPDRDRVQRPGRVRWPAPVPALREPVVVAGRQGQP